MKIRVATVAMAAVPITTYTYCLRLHIQAFTFNVQSQQMYKLEKNRMRNKSVAVTVANHFLPSDS